ncbi:lytic transglycosylase domain-containing protein [Alkanindiges illinoisensis]|uniref:Lytic transglycosylase domain-containing protein n=1 Tax=Alkanindiges illinoisensis TaxID=197183 RepID=A0A4Y7XF28_9GAMM|nr:lytic transglycosylase domain-containing protein [Alkanindiges illinoisensis]
MQVQPTLTAFFHSKRSLLLSLISSIALLSTVPAQAGNLYVYKNKNGDTLLTNVRGDKSFGEYNTKVKVTYYPDTNVHSYRNWGGSESAVLPSYSKNKNLYDGIIAQAASTHQVDSGLIKAVMHTESGFNPNARSPVGAQGLMQLMPATARRFAVSNAYDPAQNVLGAAQYLSFLLKRFNYNTELALAAYNAGEGNVDKYRGIPPFRETQDYVRRVMSRYKNLYAGNISTTPMSASAMSASYNTLAQAQQVAPVSAVSSSSNVISRAPVKVYAVDGVYTASNIETY